ncbi:uncharacterized protein FSUBG_12680 [Fusarium subglutinans]|uniref:Myb-like domain-containing protein n=1 Tax=Gibberella subglutinans TaxID=42677 RepID=A0A8H5L4N7_GIBSU|nr:uncharacterized protein FSUBG_12680 [Fusarium subglutinans]KAF5584717.1 hypothetical protein FSUBG_12680 [Fusarium subglutinans]
MQRDDYPSIDQAPFEPGFSAEWNSISSLPTPALPSNALAESAGWFQSLGPAAALSGDDPNTMAGVYARGFNGLSLNGFIHTEHPGATGQAVDHSQDFAKSMSSVHPSIMEQLITKRAPSFTVIDANEASPSYGGGDPTTQSIASTPSSNTGWTKEQDKLLMSLKAQGLGYSAIQDEMRKEFGWTRNKNVLVKRFAVLKKRCKPQIKTRIIRDISRKITPEIVKAVGKELEKVTSSGSNSISTELEDLVPLRLQELVEGLVADIGVSLHQIDEDDKRSSA